MPWYSAAAAAVQELPRLPLPSSNGAVVAASPVGKMGSSLVGPGVAAMYVDAVVTHVLAFLCSAGSVVAAATQSGTVHFFTVCAVAS